MKIFLFDFDGVIIDTLPIGVEVYNSLLQKYKVPVQFTKKSFTDMFLDNFHDGLAQVVPDEEVRERILKERAQEYIGRKDDFRIFDGMERALEDLTQAGESIVISSNRTNFIRALLESRGIESIQEILGGDVDKSKVKKINWQKEKFPDSEIYYIGDTIGDIKEGKQTGVKTVGTTWGFHSKSQMEAENPDFLFDNPNELSSLI